MTDSRIESAIQKYGLSVSTIACKLGMFREDVHNYIRVRNGGTPLNRTIVPRSVRVKELRKPSKTNNPRIKAKRRIERFHVGPWPNTDLLRKPFRAMSPFSEKSGEKLGQRTKRYLQFLRDLPMPKEQ